MGIMSKSSRLPERPKPPTLDEIEDDLLAAKKTDIVLSVGEKHLQTMNLGASCGQSQESDFPVTPTASSPSVMDQPAVSPSQIKESYSKVVRLLDLYTSLKDAPAALQERISKLQVVGADMSESITQLKSLSHGLGLDDHPVHDSEASGDAVGKNREMPSSSLSKEKAKPKSKRKK